MKILLASTLDSTHTVRWANGLSERGHDVLAFSTRPPLAGLLPEVRTVVRGGFGKLDYLIRGPALRRTVREERPDIVHAHFASGYGFLCANWLDRGSWILSVWGSDIFDFPAGPVRRRLLARNLARAGALLATSECLAKETAKHTGRPLRLTPFGVDAKRFRPRPEEREDDGLLRIGTARVLKPKYGIDTLIEAFALLRKRIRRRTRLLVAGEGPDRSKLERLAADRGIADSVEFKGWLSHDQLPSFLNGLDVFCALSRLDSESFGVAPLEASACGVPVIASNVGGLPETVRHQETGLLVGREAPQEAAEGLTALLDDSNLRHRLGQAGRAFAVERYDWERSLDIMERIYQDFPMR